MSKETLLAEIGKQLPIKALYMDVAHPTLSEIGKSLQGLTRVALSPISGMVWGYDKISDYLDYAIPKYFGDRKIKKENIITPDISIAGPAIEAMRYTANKQKIREMYKNLLGAAMNIDTADEVHPAFIEVIKQLTPNEAIFLEYLFGYRKAMIDYESTSGFFNKNVIEISEEYSNEDTESYINNFIRLGLFEKTQTVRETCEVEFIEVEKIALKQIRESAIEDDIEIDLDNLNVRFYYYWFQPTAFGYNFADNAMN